MNDGNLTFVNSLKILNMFVVLFMKYRNNFENEFENKNKKESNIINNNTNNVLRNEDSEIYIDIPIDNLVD